MSECCVRELTLEEEVNALEIDECVKNRIIVKIERILDENHKQGEFLGNCHYEMDRLRDAIVSQAKMLGRLEEEIRSMRNS